MWQTLYTPLYLLEWRNLRIQIEDISECTLEKGQKEANYECHKNVQKYLIRLIKYYIILAGGITVWIHMTSINKATGIFGKLTTNMSGTKLTDFTVQVKWFKNRAYFS